MSRKIKNQRAITLIALVITIIILLILAGISIASLTSSGLFGKAEEAKVKTEIANIEEEANLIYSELTISQYMDKMKNPTMSDIVSKLIGKGYEIEEVIATGSTITGISLDKEIVSLSPNETSTLTVTYDGNSEPISYYAKIGEGYYKMILVKGVVKVERTPSEIDKSSIPETLTVTSNNGKVTVESVNGSVITLKGGENVGNSTITVKFGSHIVTCEARVIIRPTDTSEEVSGVTFSTDYGKIDVIWLKDNTKEVVSTPNVPILTSDGESMTPVKWNDSNNVVPTTNTDTNWYNYGENKWANARTANESYFVWIPRYAYRITYYQNETSTDPTGYYDGYGQWKAEDASIRLKLDDGVDTVDYNGEKYIVHPAFDNNVEMGGWSNKLSGFWFAKFEMSGATGEELKSTYGVASQRNQKIGIQYTNARTATYGYTGTVDLFDNKVSYMNSHMTKNSEWGAVAYLTHSKYGIDGQEISINANRSYYTGGGENTAYILNVNQSTTGNLYGIYDMSGGSWEYTAGFNSVDGNGNFPYYGWTEATGLTGDSDSTKYATKYKNETGAYSGNNIVYGVGKIGDGTKEVNKGGAYNKDEIGGEHTNWFDDCPYLVCSTIPIFTVGGTAGSTVTAGVFAHNAESSGPNNGFSFRVALTPSN